ncbi:MAG: glycosyltransferase family 4 protein [Candidatus Tectomicrobia bacterium]|uniref:Glycosyltransferase family 4 protein n=1 Tax=Tectimicrobiota bacterium TaxID=2528274 RepID=A0A932GQK6_UNCTE|nr:glycosyltransferase family 4 protein [Candidatus Tectomicrobia bacterium]
MLAILTTHPIQYQVPLWKELARRGEVPFEVWYLSDQGYQESFDQGFGRAFSWDIDMLGGYSYRFLKTHPLRAEITRFRGTRIGSLGPLFQELDVHALLVNGWYPQAYWQAVFQARRAGIPVLLRAETNDLRRASWWKEMVKRPLLKLLFQRVSVFLTVGVANRRLYEKFGIPESRLIAAPYCVDNRRFLETARSYEPQRSMLREEWGIPPDSICFLFSGKLIPKKHFQDILSALEVLSVKRTQFFVKCPIHLLVVGDGSMRGMFEERAEVLRSMTGRRCVTFAGFMNQTEIPKAYVAADCLILPSDAGETWGLVVNEAMACGLPAIVSDQAGCGPDLIDPGRTGDFFPMGDVERLAVRMAAWSDPVRCHSAKAAVREKIAGYSIERAVDGILEGLRIVQRASTSGVSTWHAGIPAG